MQFLLYQFRTKGGSVVATRGRNAEEAKYFLSQIHGLEVELEGFCSIYSAFIYSTSHPFDWLNNPPRWISPDHPFVPNDYDFRNRFFR